MPDPIYRQIADTLRQQIESGRLQAGAQLPTELEIADTWGTSRSTVRDAIKLLIARSLVEARAGQGTFVTQKITPIVTDLSATHDLGTGGEDARYYIDILRQNRTPRSTVPRVEIRPARGVVATELQLEEGSQVVCRRQQRFVDEQPYSLQRSFYSMELVTARGANRLIQAVDITEGAIQYLRNEHGIEQMGYRDVITVRTPRSAEADFFKLREDGTVAVFENFRTSYDQHGKPIRITVTVYPADRNRFVINVPLAEAESGG
ncbi:MAG TPA: GntR family transcriptional regulator [Streptosporangiaceae bacterium]|jgi:GntR family transcriptional regulator